MAGIYKSKEVPKLSHFILKNNAHCLTETKNTPINYTTL